MKWLLIEVLQVQVGPAEKNIVSYHKSIDLWVEQGQFFFPRSHLFVILDHPPWCRFQILLHPRKKGSNS